MADDDDTLTRAKGKVTEATGWATGDREVEAKGKVEAETGDEPDDETVDEVEDEVREEHGDI
ncbi:MAG: CsbD family protein [Acidimicrobiales bacterium]